MPTLFDAQPKNANLTALAGLTPAADRLPYFSGASTAALATFTAAARNLLDDTTATAMATTLGLGTGDSVTHNNLTLGDGTGQHRINLDSAAGQTPGILWKVGGLARWLFYTTNAETGSDAGSDLVFGRAFDDFGVGIDNPITITRAAGGLITIARPMSCNSALTIGSGLTFNDNSHITVNTATGSKFGTGTNQKIAFWNKTPIVQPTTGITGATRVGGGGTTITTTDTYGGYTVAQIAAALINVGLLA